ncbi:hypothetical protein CEP54_006610 [Fusarium duplospermum]|uniref:Uncharacterized protein n=1 Tax=Fusarium duplospermum TaxID=1325734 RepID=A0A428Q669_9HYPO|nr:hypothetical protein CEP54_006610 [Fusarium duplospermum]
MHFLSDDREVDSKAARMQVLCLGLSRCATSSLQAALESDVLSAGPCMHMAHIAPHANREQIVIDAINQEDTEKRQKLLHKIYDGYASACDFPGWLFVPDLMDMYPDAAVVLNTRKSSQAWAESIGNSHSFFGSRWYYWPTFLWKTDRLHYAIHRTSYAWVQRRFGIANMFTAKFYERYNDWVREEAKKRGKPILEWQATDGWEPLCEFIGKEPPKDKRAFPHLNDANQMTFVKRILVGRGLVAWVALFGVAWGGWKSWPWVLEKLVSLRG